MRLPPLLLRALDAALTWLVSDARRPDVTIGVKTFTDYDRPGSRLPDGEPVYLERWWVIARNRWPINVYLHLLHRSDDDRALHDHPWANVSIVLSGRYREHTPAGVFLREAGDVVRRPAEALHRLELVDGAPCRTLFLTGRVSRVWGFLCPKGWIPHTDFTARNAEGLTKGCGEFEVRP